MDAALKELKEEESTAMVAAGEGIRLFLPAQRKNGPVSADDEPDHRTRPGSE